MDHPAEEGQSSFPRRVREDVSAPFIYTKVIKAEGLTTTLDLLSESIRLSCLFWQVMWGRYPLLDWTTRLIINISKYTQRIHSVIQSDVRVTDERPTAERLALCAHTSSHADTFLSYFHSLNILLWPTDEVLHCRFQIDSELNWVSQNSPFFAPRCEHITTSADLY